MARNEVMGGVIGVEMEAANLRAFLDAIGDAGGNDSPSWLLVGYALVDRLDASLARMREVAASVDQVAD